MSLFEWLGETRDPAPIGTIEAGAPETGQWRPRAIVFRGALAIIFAAAIGAGIARAAETVTEAIVLTVVAVAYCGVAYWVTPRPEQDNTGWAGGLIDHPFRWSDDVNRVLVFVAIILWPGKFLTVSLRDVVRYWRGERFMVLPR